MRLELQHGSRGVGHEGAAGETPLNASLASVSGRLEPAPVHIPYSTEIHCVQL